MKGFRRLGPLTGALAVILLIVGFAMGGESPDSDDSAREVVRFFNDHDGREMFGAALEAAAAVAMLFFAAILANAIRQAGERTTRMATAALVGGTVAAVGFAADGAIRFVLADTAGDIDPSASQALNALWGSFFFPMVAGLVTLLLATAIAGYGTRLLPRWLFWITIVIVIVMFTPLGFIGALASGIWIIVVSILLLRREAPAAQTVPVATT